MTNLLKVPSPEADDRLVNLADWVEMKAVLEADGNASQEDLARAISRAYSMNETNAKGLAADVFKELADRYTACAPIEGMASGYEYPFVLNDTGNLLSMRTPLSTRTKAGIIYLFLLTASRADMDAQRKMNGLDPTVIFERLCADVLINFWGGRSALADSIVFGTARKKAAHNNKFQSNIEHLCLTLREGRGMKVGAKLPGAGDGKLDVVVWRIFADGRSGGLVGFAQCKTGIHWKTHLTKLQPEAFTRSYLKQPLIIHPIRVYMVPHRLEEKEWDDHSLHGGLLLDRCRMVQYGYKISADVFDNCKQWLHAAISRQQQGQFQL
jgi:hypothetical protein